MVLERLSLLIDLESIMDYTPNLFFQATAKEMTSCPNCENPVGESQRICTICGTNLANLRWELARTKTSPQMKSTQRLVRVGEELNNAIASGARLVRYLSDGKQAIVELA
jgi:hypothetical protein